jgi:hypothetical protein
MKRTATALVVGLAVLSLFAGKAGAVPVAFPGAEGHGAYAVGGRGGDVYHVTSLADTSTPGTLRYGIATAGGTASTGRTIVFDVSGTIALVSNLTINKSYITIAGQTAPGDGICLRDRNLAIGASHIIVRYIRARLGDESLTESDAVSINSGNNIIMDHISASWSVDEVFSCSTSQPTLSNVTVQWSIISEALWHSIHDKGTHSYGALIRGCYDAKFSYHHNLFAHNYSRNPRPGNYDSTVSDGNPYWEDPCGLLFDFRNNVLYNWGGTRPGYDADLDSVCRYNYVGNYAKLGPNSSVGGLYSAACKYFRGYYTGNYYNGSYAADDWQWVIWNGTWTAAQKTAYKMSVPFDAGPILTDTALDARDRVFAHGGASLPLRDSVDTRVVNDVINGTGAIIDTQGQVGGWPTLNSSPAPLDTDQDGMPDVWETANDLSPTNAADRNYYTLNGDYTNLEVYLNSLIPDGTYNIVDDTTAPTPDPMTWAQVPQASSWDTITMTATTATDVSGVEYYFACRAGGGHDSGWQTSSTYIDSGLTTGVSYSYQVIARDKSSNQNETGWSGTSSATPQPDNTPPTPDPMTWQVAPYAISMTSVSMTASAASDIAGVQYYFANLSIGGHDSGWQSSPTFVDGGLTPGASYTYMVKARDISPWANETGWSGQSEVTMPTLPVLNPPSAYWMFDEAGGTTTYDSIGTANGTLQGSATWTAGKYDNAVTFPTSSTPAPSVYVPHSTAIDFGTESFSVSMWAKQPVSYSGQYELFIKGTIGSGDFPGSGKRYELYRKDATFRFAIDDNVTKTEISVPTTGICTGDWLHIVAVRDIAADHIRLYVNGSSVSTLTDSTDNSISQTEPLYIGYKMFPGAVDDLRIYRYALTQDQVTAVYGGAGLPDNDNTAPTPNPMTWATAPHATGAYQIAMTATAASDTSGVEYFFANATDPNHNSGWQDGTTYADSGLVNNTEYTYTVISRDKSASQNETDWSGTASATTLRYDCAGTATSDFDANCQVDFMDLAALATTWTGGIEGWTGLKQFAEEWLLCNRDPAGECWQ